ncbi:cytochrome c553 [Breoghania corrubedonensis]|uniref:Cytochrome c553 n=1 Tax=Breoghania corrubedonensis TaxID=665038 RepID=A0A2T5VHY9_9HYPH|nr:cytochrome c [Breoghania corrubedonensis]PTW63336.1 cytochrome c553 [Breoghania corrubedonensis]
MKVSRIAKVLLLAIAISGLSWSGAQAAASVAAGEKLAKLWCASCHVVSPDQTRGNPDVPPFSEIAENSTLSSEQIETLLSGTHPVMPDMSLSRAEIDALVAYIQSLKAR